MRLILASTSPRRRELMAEAGYEATIIAPSATAECGVCSKETPPEFAVRMAYQKAIDVADRLLGEQSPSAMQPAIVIGCDTIAECAGQILGKPVDIAHARTMLKLLSGRVHHVYSGICLCVLPARECHVEVDRTTLQMATLSDEELDAYLQTGLWEGKAGAFGLQDRPHWLRIDEGSESNVVGLPMELLAKMLATHRVSK